MGAGWLQNGAIESNGQITWTGTAEGNEATAWSWWATHTAGYGDVVANTVYYTQATGSGSSTATFRITSTREYALPVITKDYLYMPDLVVTSLSATSNEVRVTIKNAGTAPTVNNFWVDVSFDPRVQPPQINQPWPRIASHGVVWGVTDNLAPGESLELVTGGDYFLDRRTAAGRRIRRGRRSGPMSIRSIGRRPGAR